MRFRRKAKLDPGQVTDVRGRRVGGPAALRWEEAASGSPSS
jgi:hypothetical protein